MCGLAGVYDRRGAAQRLARPLRRATDALAHRGPDAEGFFFDGPVGLGFRRLSILDLSQAGDQPMTSADGAWTLVFNGEIYNFLELRRELAAAGVRFRSDSDTEVLVEGLAAWGTRCFDRCNGMWAVLAWHAPTRTLIACRGPYGIKPLYFSDQGDWIGFASEIKGLRALGCELGMVDATAARTFVDLGELDTGTRTFYSRVERLRPGELYIWRDGQALRRQPYADGTALADVPAFAETPRGEAAYIETFRAAFLDSVRLRLRADVDVGTCLSGGLDSTAIACAAARHLEAERAATCRHAFTALMPEYDESRFIRPVIEQTGAEWHVTVADDRQLLDNAVHFFAIHDEPVHSLSPFAGYLVMGLAADAGVKVLLNGQGADELLSGYTSTIMPFLRSLLASDGPAYSMRQAIAEAGEPRQGVRLFARAAAGRAARALPAAIEASLRSGGATRTAEDPDLLHADGAMGSPLVVGTPPTASLAATLHDQVHRSPLPLYLRIEDANSSAFSLEARLPFLDPTLVALARAAPARLLRRDGLNKYLLRRILPGLVPDIVWQRRDKMGFPVPHARWLRGPLREIVTSTLAPDRLRRRGWYDVAAVTRSLTTFLQGAGTTVPPRLLRVFLLERWASDHLDARTG